MSERKGERTRVSVCHIQDLMLGSSKFLSTVLPHGLLKLLYHHISAVKEYFHKYITEVFFFPFNGTYTLKIPVFLVYINLSNVLSTDMK